MQVVMNKCFLLNPEKQLAQIRLDILEKKTLTPTHQFRKNVAEPKARRLGYFKNHLTINRLKSVSDFRKPTILNGFRKPETDFNLLIV